MGDTSTKRGPSERIDSPAIWIIIRGVEILYAVVWAKMAYLTLGTDSFVEAVVTSAILFFVLGGFVHRIGTGWADGGGIHYRRYFRRKTLAWPDVEEIQWKGARIRVLVKSKRKSKPVVEFLLNPLKWVGVYWSHRLGADVDPPEILTYACHTFRPDADEFGSSDFTVGGESLS